MEEKKPSEALVDKVSSDRLQLLKSRLGVAKAFSKKPHESWKRYIAEYKIDNFDSTSEIRDKVRIGYIFRKTETEIPAIFDDQPELFIKGRTNDYKDVEDIYTSAYDLLWDKQNLEEVIEDAGVYFELLGMGFVSSPYLVKTKKVKEPLLQPQIDPMTGQPQMDEAGQPVQTQALDEKGQPVFSEYEVPIYDMPKAVAKDPFKIHFSPETKFSYSMSSENCPYYFEEEVWGVEKIKALFGKEVTASEKMYTGDTDVDTQIDEAMDRKLDVVSDDLKRSKVYLYYGTLPENMAKGIKDSEGSPIEWSYDKEYKIYFTNNEELEVTECPYTSYPLHVVGNYGLANEFWKFGDAKHLLPLVQELETYRSQILMHTRKMANPKPLIELTSEVDEQAFTDPRVGKPVKYSGTPPTYLSPANLGSEVQIGVDMVRTDLEKTSPSFDLNGGGGTSQVKTPRGIATFAEAADKGARRKRKKIARLIRQLMIFQFQQIGQNWASDGTKMLEVGGKVEPVTPEVLQVLTDTDLLDKVNIEIESLSVNKVQMKQDALDLFDMASRFPQIFNLVEIGKDTLQNGFNKRDADRYMVSMDQMNTQAIQGFLQQLAQQNPELANAVMQYVGQPNMKTLQDGQPEGMPPTQGEAPQEPPTGSMPPMGGF